MNRAMFRPAARPPSAGGWPSPGELERGDVPSSGRPIARLEQCASGCAFSTLRPRRRSPRKTEARWSKVWETQLQPRELNRAMFTPFDRRRDPIVAPRARAPAAFSPCFTRSVGPWDSGVRRLDCGVYCAGPIGRETIAEDPAAQGGHGVDAGPLVVGPDGPDLQRFHSATAPLQWRAFVREEPKDGTALRAAKAALRADRRA